MGSVVPMHPNVWFLQVGLGVNTDIPGFLFHCNCTASDVLGSGGEGATVVALGGSGTSCLAGFKFRLLGF